MFYEFVDDNIYQDTFSHLFQNVSHISPKQKHGDTLVCHLLHILGPRQSRAQIPTTESIYIEINTNLNQELLRAWEQISLSCCDSLDNLLLTLGSLKITQF